MRTRADRIRTYLPTVTVHPTASASIRPAGARMSVPNYAIGEFYLIECRNLNCAVARLDRQGPEGRQSQACQGVRPTRRRQPSKCTGAQLRYRPDHRPSGICVFVWGVDQRFEHRLALVRCAWCRAGSVPAPAPLSGQKAEHYLIRESSIDPSRLTQCSFR